VIELIELHAFPWLMDLLQSDETKDASSCGVSSRCPQRIDYGQHGCAGLLINQQQFVPPTLGSGHTIPRPSPSHSSHLLFADLGLSSGIFSALSVLRFVSIAAGATADLAVGVEIGLFVGAGPSVVPVWELPAQPVARTPPPITKALYSLFSFILFL